MKRGNVYRAGKVMGDYLPGAGQIDVYYRARAWPDHLYCLEGTIWSDRLVRGFLASGLKGIHHFPLELRAVDHKGLSALPDPCYRWVLPEMGVPAIPSMSDLVTPCPIEPETGFYDLSVGGGLRRWKFDFSDWDGQDLLYFSTTRSRTLLCSERFKNLVEKSKFTNFRFVAEDGEGIGTYLF